ncbi:MAG: MFS transporter [Alphaproteobacteria bacterium]|nr:MFS transporter [Alphaproteobacteria bacterium]
MNVGFFGIQYSFSLQQNAVNPIYKFLGAENGDLPILQIAGPVTGLLVQPIIGAWSDKTWHPKWGRRKPFFLIGALFCSLGLFLFPFSSALWMAVGLLWILDAANNTAMEPYRAFVADKLNHNQQPLGFQAQSFFTGLGQCLAPLSLFACQSFAFFNKESSAGIPYWVFASFLFGAVFSIISMLWSTSTTPEIPPSPEALQELKSEKFSIFSPFITIAQAVKDMPVNMWKLSLVYLFQWYALKCYWDYRDLTLATSIFHAPDYTGALYKEAVAFGSLLSTWSNVFTFCSAFALVWFAKKLGAKNVHTFCLLVAAVSFYFIPQINDKFYIYLPILGFGLAWACIMGIPYLMIISDIPKNKYGVYMGIINMMICIPMFVYAASFGWVFNHILEAKPEYAIYAGSVLILIAAILTQTIKPSNNYFK